VAVTIGRQPEISRLARFSLTTADAAGLARFYESAFGFRRVASQRLSGNAFEKSMDIGGGAERIILALGQERLELLQFDRPGRPYPGDSSASDPIFQHFAIVAADIDRAYERLTAIPGWAAISSRGPQRLPIASGGVTAFKFRDPEGHPLELLAFPDGDMPARWRSSHRGNPCLGIDHSALSVADSARSVGFYAEHGLRISNRFINFGPAQGRLDGLHAPRVEIVALAPHQATPHVELLCYQSIPRAHRIDLQNNDIAATRLVFETSDRSNAERGGYMRDPDGHHLLLIPSGDE